MKGFHTIAGTPRSGSTLLANILNQNPSFHATSTSPIAGVIGGMTQVFSNLDEVKNDLINNKEQTEAWIHSIMKHVIEAKYEKIDKVIFDKCRGWGSVINVLNVIYPNAKHLVMVRDPRDIFASIEKQHRKTPAFDTSNTPFDRTLAARADHMFSKAGLIGMAINATEDMLLRKYNNCLYIKYEDLANDPELILSRIYAFIGIKPFKHNFDDVKNTSTDIDGLYHNKYPHKGSGKIKPVVGEYKSFFTENLGTQIVNSSLGFCRQFGYGQ